MTCRALHRACRWKQGPVFGGRGDPAQERREEVASHCSRSGVRSKPGLAHAACVVPIALHRGPNAISDKVQPGPAERWKGAACTGLQRGTQGARGSGAPRSWGVSTAARVGDEAGACQSEPAKHTAL